jgi:N-acyl-L-homoserine lactone synthetase
VYCVEKGWVEQHQHEDGLEKDKYDSQSKHFIVTRDSQNIVGTARLICSTSENECLPLMQHIDCSSMRKANCVEVSRVALRGNKTSKIYLILGLFRLIFQYCKRHHISHLLFATEPVMVKLIEKVRIPFDVIGENFEYLGSETVPIAIPICDSREVALSKANPDFYQWFTDNPISISKLPKLV